MFGILGCTKRLATYRLSRRTHGLASHQTPSAHILELDFLGSIKGYHDDSVTANAPPKYGAAWLEVTLTGYRSGILQQCDFDNSITPGDD
jgi:hypothetical protein